MERLSDVDLGSQLLSIVVAAGLVAFALLVFRIFISIAKAFTKNIKSKFTSNLNQNDENNGFSKSGQD